MKAYSITIAGNDTFQYSDILEFESFAAAYAGAEKQLDRLSKVTIEKLEIVEITLIA